MDPRSYSGDFLSLSVGDRPVVDLGPLNELFYNGRSKFFAPIFLQQPLCSLKFKISLKN